MPRRTVACVLALGLAIGLVGFLLVSAAGADRLERFRQLAASRLSAVDLPGPETAVGTFTEIYTLLDDEILENLDAGSLFASEGFLQERLDAFMEVWGGSTFHILTLPQADLTVGSFQLSPGAWGNSVRVYRRAGQQGELVAAIHRTGTPHLFPMPPTQTGQGQFLALWVGPRSPRGTPAIRIELWRQHGDRVRTVWSTADLFGDELYATAYNVRGEELSVRYEVRYPGWKPGCGEQTEQEDHYRYAPASGTFLLVRRQVHNGWHRELHAVVEQLLNALRQNDQRVLSALGVPPDVRLRLSDRLERDPACDIQDDSSASVVTVSATVPGDAHPWALRFRRTRDGWRLDGAERFGDRSVETRVLQ